MSLFGNSAVKYFVWVLLLYFIMRILNLTLLPIFNDEAIYLDWGWRETHTPGMLYYSLYDSKPPMLMWLFGMAQHIFVDPLFAGRLVSVVSGAFGLWGIFLIGKTFFTRQIAVWSCLIYVLVPIFMFFDRQALMESAVGSVGIFACFCAVQLWITHRRKYAYWLGIVLGLGFFIKYSAVLFIAAYFVLSCFLWWRSKQKGIIVKEAGIVFGMFCIVIFLLLINPEFWSGLSKNAQYSLTVGELLRFPIFTWLKNGWANLVICFFYVTPFIFIAAIAGIGLLLKGKKQAHLLLAGWIVVCLLLQTLLIRGTSQRYLVSYLALLVVPAAYFFQVVSERKKMGGWVLFIGSLVAPIILTGILIISPSLYILSMEKMNAYSGSEYLRGYTSGYGIVEVKEYLESVSKNSRIFVGYALNSGNPESALAVYFDKSKYVNAGYLDSRQFGSSLNGIDCISFPMKLYFVSRNDELAGLDRFLVEVKRFKNEYSDYSVGVYTLKEPCEGKSAKVEAVLR